MKKITIGRSNKSDIIVKDMADVVSRNHAVIMVSFWGKMVLYDKSTNGTFVNGNRIPKPDGVTVTRKDVIKLANMYELDWNDVEDPYKSTKIALFSSLAALILLLAAIPFVPEGWFHFNSDKSSADTVIVKQPTDSVADVAVLEDDTVISGKADADIVTVDKSKITNKRYNNKNKKTEIKKSENPVEQHDTPGESKHNGDGSNQMPIIY